MAIFDDDLEIALYLLAHFDEIAFVFLKLGPLIGLAMEFHVD